MVFSSINARFQPKIRSSRDASHFNRTAVTQRLGRGVEFIESCMYNVCIVEICFEWDPAKNKENKRKHGVSFEEAKAVFYDPNAIQFFDPDHSEAEDRFILLGMSYQLRILVVCHCYRKEDSVIRIISARKANKKESINYAR